MFCVIEAECMLNLWLLQESLVLGVVVLDVRSQTGVLHKGPQQQNVEQDFGDQVNSPKAAKFTIKTGNFQ